MFTPKFQSNANPAVGPSDPSVRPMQPRRRHLAQRWRRSHYSRLSRGPTAVHVSSHTRHTAHRSQIRGEHEESVGRLNMTIHMIFNLAACFFAGYLYFWKAGDGLEGDAQCFAMYALNLACVQ